MFPEDDLLLFLWSFDFKLVCHFLPRKFELPESKEWVGAGCHQKTWKLKMEEWKTRADQEPQFCQQRRADFRLDPNNWVYGSNQCQNLFVRDFQLQNSTIFGHFSINLTNFLNSDQQHNLALKHFWLVDFRSNLVNLSIGILKLPKFGPDPCCCHFSKSFNYWSNFEYLNSFCVVYRYVRKWSAVLITRVILFVF